MSYKVNSFPVSKGKVNLTSGAIDGVALCVVDGSITVTWDDDTTSVLDLIAGNAIDLVNAKSAVITSGTYHKG